MSPLDHRSRLEWRVLPRFTDYISAMPDGAVLTSDGAERTAEGAFLFPLQTSPGNSEHSTPEEGSSLFAFDGVVRFVGHGGMLNLPLGAIEIEVARDGACRLTIADPDEPEVRLLFAFGTAQVGGTVHTANLVLAEDGSELFFYKYPIGLPLEPAEIIRFAGSDTAPSNLAGHEPSDGL